LRRRHRKRRLALELLQERERALGEPRLDPCDGDVAVQIRGGRGEHRGFLAHLGLGACAAQA
jgi:hypothetical protein